MTVNANYNPACYETYRTGYAEIAVGIPYTTDALGLGITEDSLQIREEVLTNPVYGDVNGGQAGQPIEEQYLGELHFVQFTLTSFNLAVHRALLGRAQVAVPGTIPQANIGQFMMATRAIRLLINTPEVEDVRNYWCALPLQPIEYGVGTRAQSIQYGFVCRRPPCTHAKAEILYDNDSNLTYTP